MFSRYDRQTIIQSVYCYPQSDTYKNFYNIQDLDKLHALEADLTSVRLTELLSGALNGKFGTTHLRNIHKYIFQDLYPFAGKIRAEDIWKGDTFFCQTIYIEANLDRVLNALKDENHLKNYDHEKTISRLAFYLSELNLIHPFREGNGRAIREFIRQLASKNGYIIDWYKLDPKTMLTATIMAANNDFTILEDCFRAVIFKE